MGKDLNTGKYLSLNQIHRIRLEKPLYGFRAWGVKGRHLTSLNDREEIWPPKYPAVAKCDGVNEYGKKIHSKGCSPHWQCGCGIFAHVHADDVPTSHSMHCVLAVGVVALWGKVIECIELITNGKECSYYLSEFAYPKHLLLISKKVSRSHADSLSKLYRVSVDTLQTDSWSADSWYVKTAVKWFLLYGRKFVFHDWRMMNIIDVQPKIDELPTPLRGGETWKPTSARQSRK